MQRQLMSELIAWKSRTNRKPLLLKGARQTGKTWLLNEFASQQYRNVIRFDFMLEPSTRSLFDGDLDPKRIIEIRRQLNLGMIVSYIADDIITECLTFATMENNYLYATFDSKIDCMRRFKRSDDSVTASRKLVMMLFSVY